MALVLSSSIRTRMPVLRSARHVCGKSSPCWKIEPSEALQAGFLTRRITKQTGKAGMRWLRVGTVVAQENEAFLGIIVTE
jgi:hypothetical protein